MSYPDQRFLPPNCRIGVIDYSSEFQPLLYQAGLNEQSYDEICIVQIDILITEIDDYTVIKNLRELANALELRRQRQQNPDITGLEPALSRKSKDS